MNAVFGLVIWAGCLYFLVGCESGKGAPTSTENSPPPMTGDFAPLKVGLSWKYKGYYDQPMMPEPWGDDNKDSIARTLTVISRKQEENAVASYVVLFHDSLFSRNAHYLFQADTVYPPPDRFIYPKDSVLETLRTIYEAADGTLGSPGDSEATWFFNRHLFLDSAIHRSIHLGSVSLALTDSTPIPPDVGYPTPYNSRVYIQNVGLLSLSKLECSPCCCNSTSKKTWTYRLKEFNGISIETYSVTDGKN